ncbi:hypothetical protein COCNU_scaffold011527G000020 [Cocos nucifera]|nr:hypothetical protein [Cocos nucifera]
MPASSIWSMLLLALTLEGDKSPMYQAPLEGDVDDAARQPTFLSFLVTTAPLADLPLLQAGVGGIYPVVLFDELFNLVLELNVFLSIVAVVVMVGALPASIVRIWGGRSPSGPGGWLLTSPRI